MKKGLLVVVSLVLVAAVLLAGCGSDESANAANVQGLVTTGDLQALLESGISQQTGVWVTGTGKVAVVPDVAILRLGVEAQAATVDQAQRDAAAAMAGVMAALNGNGVADKDIQTQWYNIYPVTKWVEDSREQITIGYRVTNTVAAKIRDIDKAGTIIDAVAEAGGDMTRVEGISFTVGEPEAYYDEAREKAILDAKAKAEHIASVADVTLGKLLYIAESGGFAPPPPYPVRSFAEGLDGAVTSISPGETEISITVQMVYAMQ